MEGLDLNQLRDKCLKSLYACTNNVSKYLEETQRDEEYNKMRGCVTEYCKMEQQQQAGMKALLSFEKESDFSDYASLNEQFDNKLAQHTKRNPKFDKHQYMVEFERHVRTAQRVQEHSQGTDIAITETIDTYLDPVTKKRITNPVRNIICQHVYDKDTADDIIRNRKNRGCPCMGCSNKQPMQSQHVQPDQELLGTIQRSQTSQEY